MDPIRWRVEMSFHGPRGRSDATQEVEATSRAQAVEIAGLRGSRGHGRLRPGEVIEIAPVVNPKLAAHFTWLADEWHAATAVSSSLMTKGGHPAYREIIGLGSSVLPLLLERFRVKPDWWFEALSSIVGEDVAADAADFEDGRARWLAWGETQGFIPPA